MSDDMKIGPTGRFPQGKLSPDDKGELAILLSSNHQTKLVRIDFNTPCTWLALTFAQARELAEELMSRTTEY